MKINIKNAEKIEKKVKVAQSGARSRLIDVDKIRENIEEIEAGLATRKIPKKNWPGVLVTIDPYRVSNSYARQWWYPQTTVAEIVRGKNDWFMVDVRRQKCGSCAYGASDASPTVLL